VAGKQTRRGGGAMLPNMSAAEFSEQEINPPVGKKFAEPNAKF